MIKTLGHLPDPAEVLPTLNQGIWHFSFTHLPAYETDSASVEIEGLIEVTPEALSLSLSAGKLSDVTAQPSLREICAVNALPFLEVTSPWPLEVVKVAKPWGAEIWYTGIEQRGVCQAAGMPLPWLLDCLPQALTGRAFKAAPLLLKILDPLPNPALGDLYFELHDKKIEVYVVTQVDRDTWPNGRGKIRYGFNQALRNTYQDDEAFKAAYLSSVQAYQACRNDIDNMLEVNKAAEGINSQDPVTTELMESWLKQLPSEVQSKELTLREKMYAFTNTRDIAEGDVVKVEPYFPHSLQHGVRVIEFQTASYERYILSFGQKVLTQDHWDTEAALDSAILSLPPAENPEADSIKLAEGVTEEIIADFEAFTAKRISLASGADFRLPTSKDYQLIICAAGSVTAEHDVLEAEQARLLPANQPGVRLTCAAPAVCIVAQPKST